METTITATELARSLSDILSRVRYRDETFIIKRNGEAVATIGPMEVPEKPMRLRELVSFLREHPLPDEDFARDVEAARSHQPPLLAPQWD